MTEFQGATKPDSISVDSYEKTLFARRVTDIPSNLQIQIEYNGAGNELYVGYGARGLATNQTGWLIYKFTYDGSNRVTARQSAFTSWTLRASGSYA